MICGAIFPILFVFFGDVTDVLTQYDTEFGLPDDEFMDAIIEVGAEVVSSGWSDGLAR